MPIGFSGWRVSIQALGDHGRMDGWEIRAYADDGTGTGIAGDGILQQDEYNAGFCRQRLH